MARTKKQKEEDIRKFRAAGGKDRPTIYIGKKAEERKKKAEEKKKKYRPDEPRPVIKLEPPKKKETAFETAKRTGRFPTITPLSIVPAGVGTIGIGAKAQAIITRTVSAIQGGKAVASLTTQRAFVGKAGKFALDKVFHAVRPVAARFATNPKTIGLSKSLLMRIVKNPAFIIGAIGSYPFAYFIKEEALQTINIAIFKAVDAGDTEGAEQLIETVDEMLAGEKEFLGLIPYANVVEKFVGPNGFFAAAGKANDEWKRILNIKEEEAAGTRETEFARERRISDEAAFERKREFAAEEEERFAEIREEGEERVEKETERFEDIRKASEQRELDEMNFKEEYFALIRDGRYDEAAALLDAYEAKLKGGV